MSGGSLPPGLQMAAFSLRPPHTGRAERESSCVSFVRALTLLRRTPPSDLSTSQRPPLLTPSPWGSAFQHTEFRGHKHSVHKSRGTDTWTKKGAVKSGGGEKCSPWSWWETWALGVRVGDGAAGAAGAAAEMGSGPPAREGVLRDSWGRSQERWNGGALGCRKGLTQAGPRWS